MGAAVGRGKKKQAALDDVLATMDVTPRMRSRGIAYEKALNTHRDSEWDEE